MAIGGGIDEFEIEELVVRIFWWCCDRADADFPVADTPLEDAPSRPVNAFNRLVHSPMVGLSMGLKQTRFPFPHIVNVSAVCSHCNFEMGVEIRAT